MRANLELGAGLVLAERVAAALAPALGREGAHDLVAAIAASGRPFAEVLAARPEVRAHLPPERLAALLDPTTYLGSAALFVDRALGAHQLVGRRS